jgi:hypothetical protein
LAASYSPAFPASSSSSKEKKKKKKIFLDLHKSRPKKNQTARFLSLQRNDKSRWKEGRKREKKTDEGDRDRERFDGMSGTG